MTRPIATIEATVAGIPALLRVDTYTVVKGSHSRSAPSDWDYYGYTEVEYTVCDRRGRPAPWLERKITPAIDAALQVTIHEGMSA